MIYSQEYKKNTDQNLCTEKPRNSSSNSDWNASHKGSPSFSTAESSPITLVAMLVCYSFSLQQTTFLFLQLTQQLPYSPMYKPHSRISRTPSSGRNFLGKTYLCTEFTINFKWKLSKNLLHWASMNQLQKQNWNRNKDWWMQNAHERLFNKMATKFIATARVGWKPRQIKKQVLIELKTFFSIMRTFLVRFKPAWKVLSPC